MEKLKVWIDEFIVPKAKRISELDYVMALNMMFSKNSILFLGIGFLTIVFMLSQSFYWNYQENIKMMVQLGVRCYVFSMALLTTYEYAEKKVDYFESTSIAILSMFLLRVLETSSQKTDVDIYFTSLILPFILVQIVSFIEKKNVLIKFPKKVPSAVADLINLIIPMIFSIVILCSLSLVMQFVFNLSLTDFIANLSFWLAKRFDTWIVIVLLMFFTQILWLIGIHGGSVTGFITNTFYTYNILYNLECFLIDQKMPFTITNTSSVYAVVIGGAGATLSLALLMCQSKSNHLKDVAKAGFSSSLFGINEPILYATPLLHNPLFEIPFVLAPLVNILIVYVMTKTGIVSKTFIPLPWAFPGIIALPISMWSWKALYLLIGIVIVDGIIYYPFFKKYENKLLEQEGEK